MLLGKDFWSSIDSSISGLLLRSFHPRSEELGEEFHHIVIYKEGKMVHDPHPSGAGVLNITEVRYLDWTGFRF